MVERFLEKGFLLQFSVLVFGICAKIHSVLERILKKMRVVDKIQKERKEQKIKKELKLAQKLE